VHDILYILTLLLYPLSTILQNRIRKEKEKLSRQKKIKSSRTAGATRGSSSSSGGGNAGYGMGAGSGTSKGTTKNYYQGLIDEDDF